MSNDILINRLSLLLIISIDYHLFQLFASGAELQGSVCNGHEGPFFPILAQILVHKPSSALVLALFEGFDLPPPVQLSR